MPLSLSVCLSACVCSHLDKFGGFEAFEARCLQGIRKFKGYVRRISRVFQESFEGVSGVFEGSCTGDSGGFQEVPRCF